MHLELISSGVQILAMNYLVLHMFFLVSKKTAHMLKDIALLVNQHSMPIRKNHCLLL